jgi:mannose-6-phosphate isomerase-like protein (cupin superfamily)
MFTGQEPTDRPDIAQAAAGDAHGASKPATCDLDAERVRRHAERPGFRITELRMTPSQRVPWHCHTNVRDTFYVVEGRVRITLREPDDQVDLAVGEGWGPERPGRPHLVTNPGKGTATFLVLQGMGEHDFVTLPDEAPPSPARKDQGAHPLANDRSRTRPSGRHLMNRGGHS